MTQGRRVPWSVMTPCLWWHRSVVTPSMDASS